MLFGIIPGVQQNNFIKAFETGFGKTLGKIGVVIVLGSIIAEALKHTGAIQVITRSMVRLVGSKRMPLALTLTGFVLGIAIFSDVAYVILNPLVHSAAKAMNVTIATMSTGLVGALQLTHAIVPPTPGPLAAAALLGADIGKTIIYGGIVALRHARLAEATRRAVDGCSAEQAHVVGLPQVAHQVVDEPRGRRRPGRCVLGRNDDVEAPAWTDESTPFLQPSDGGLVGDPRAVQRALDQHQMR